MIRKLVSFICALLPLTISAQFNVEHLVANGRNALFFEDYVLSIQYFNRVITYKPFLYEAWYYRGMAKFYLDDYSSAENDCSEAIRRNPYIADIYDGEKITEADFPLRMIG